MPSKPNGPRGVGREVKRRMQEADMDLGEADRYLEGLAKKDIGAANARTNIWKVKGFFAWVFGLGVDDSDNGNGNGDHS